MSIFVVFGVNTRKFHEIKSIKHINNAKNTHVKFKFSLQDASESNNFQMSPNLLETNHYTHRYLKLSFLSRKMSHFLSFQSGEKDDILAS